jgi:hypothetical protein
MAASKPVPNPAAIPEKSLILLTGASGYVGGRLLPSLENQGYRLRCVARHPEILKPKVNPSTDVVAGDVLDRPSLDAAMRGVDVAYYMVHSMSSTGSFEETDRQVGAETNGGQLSWSRPSRADRPLTARSSRSGHALGERQQWVESGHRRLH